MNILLVKPPSIGDHIQPPLGLGYLASSVKEKHNVRILDMLKQGISVRSFKAYLAGSHFDVIGFQLYTIDLKAVKQLLSVVREVLPEAITVIGGPHPTVCPDETLNLYEGLADYLFIGEAEASFPQFLEQVNGGSAFSNVPGLCWRNNGQIVKNPPAALLSDLDKLPILSWDLIKPEEYPPAQHGAFYKNFPIAPIITTRGCPYRCSFCSAPVLSGGKIRKRAVSSVMEEIFLLYKTHGIREIHIVDDNFSCDKNHAKSILQAIIDSGMKISLAFPNGLRIETLDDELVGLMKKCGVYLISLGIESGSDRILGLMNKSLKVGTTVMKVELIRNSGIDMAGFFVLGFPGETEKDIEETIELSIRLPLIRANYFDFLPLPGTAIYKELLQKGELSHIDWEHFFFMSAPYSPAGITRERLRQLQKKAFWRFYMRPKIIIKNISQIQSPRHFWYLLKRFYRWVLS